MLSFLKMVGVKAVFYNYITHNRELMGKSLLLSFKELKEFLSNIIL